MNLRTIFRGAALATALVGASTAGHAALVTGNFDCITSNSAASCTQAETHLSWSWNSTTSLFAIVNAPGGGYVSDVYFDLPANIDVAFRAEDNAAGVGFKEESGQALQTAHLSGANAVSFVIDASFDSGAPGKNLGIDPGESAFFKITHLLGDSIDVAQITAGLHVQRLLNGEGESLVSVSSPVPEPASGALALLGLAIAGGVARARRSR